LRSLKQLDANFSLYIMATLAEYEVGKLDELLAALAYSETDDAAKMVEEHIQAARINRLGAMPREFALNLAMAREALGRIGDAGTKTKATALLEDVISVHQAR
jgi:hypothetical protein